MLQGVCSLQCSVVSAYVDMSGRKKNCCCSWNSASLPPSVKVTFTLCIGAAAVRDAHILSLATL